MTVHILCPHKVVRVSFDLENTILFQGTLFGQCIINDHVDCDHFIEEDCTYYGGIVHHHNPGSITDSDRCSEACDILPECKYWVYHMDNYECIAFNASARTCTSITGPQYPYIDECPGELKIYNLVLKNKINTNIKFYR